MAEPWSLLEAGDEGSYWVRSKIHFSKLCELGLGSDPATNAATLSSSLR